MMRKFAIVIEQGPSNYSAYVPDLPGCVSTERTLAEVEKNIREAMEFHIEGMIENGDPVPEPSARVIEVELPVA
jgi:predicted RNase H-like HicB family nuclease